MRDRIAQEIALLRKYYGPDVHYIEAGDWFLIPAYPAPRACEPFTVPICFKLRPGFPGIEPYGFYVGDEILFNGQKYNAAQPPEQPPFPGQWIFFSWAPEGWLATNDPMTGSNLWGWARSFSARLGEGP